MVAKCGFCGKSVYPRKREAWRGGMRYIHEFNNVSLGISLVFCTKNHKMQYINQFLRKSKFSFFFHSFDIDYKK